MRWSFKIGTIAGIRVEVHVTFLLFIVGVALYRGFLGESPAQAVSAAFLLLLIFGCVLLHELGHALAARRYGIRTRDIILLPIGGVARLERMPEKPLQEIVVAVAGPLVNVLIAGALFALSSFRIPAAEAALRGGVLETLFAINVVMVVFNMIPAFPMDGGRVLRALLAMRLPYARATRIASLVGQAFALLFGLVGLFTNTFMLLFVALFVFLAASEERALVQTRASLEGIPVRAAMLTDFRAVDVDESLQRVVDYLMSGTQQDFPVLEGPEVIGVLSRGDLALALRHHGVDARVGAVVRREAAHADASEPLEDVIQRMRALGRTAFPVLQHGALVGLVTLENVGDLLLVRDALRRHVGGRPA